MEKRQGVWYNTKNSVTVKGMIVFVSLPLSANADTSLIRGRQSGRKESLPSWRYACEILQKEAARTGASLCAKGTMPFFVALCLPNIAERNSTSQSLPLQGKQHKLKPLLAREATKIKASPDKGRRTALAVEG